MERDLFWPVFLSTLAIVLVIGTGTAYVRGWQFGAPDTAPDTLSKGEPFAAASALASRFEGYFYKDSLPFGFEDRSWTSKTNWRSADGVNGSYAAKVVVLNEYGGVEIGSPKVPGSVYHTLSFWYREDASVHDTVVELFDPKGVLLGQQPIQWYASQPVVLGQWVSVRVPLQNMGADGREIGSIAFSSGTPGIFSLDEIRLDTDVTQHPVYVPPVYGEVDPFMGARARALPYVSDLSPSEAPHWYTYRGQFIFSPKNVLYINDDLSTKTSDGLSVFREGLAWTDYRFDTTMQWGTGVSYALLARFISDGNYDSCSYALNGTGVAIYHVSKGKTELISQTPELPFHTGDEVMQLSVAVSGNTIFCYMNGERMLQAEIPGMSPQGTVGVESWDPVSGAYPHIVSKLLVTGY